MRTVRRTLSAALIGVLVLGPGGLASGADAERIALRAAGIVQSLERADAYDEDDRRSLVETIAKMPADDRPAVIHALARLEHGASDDARSGVLLDVLDEFGPTAVEAVLRDLGGAVSTRHDRVLVLWFLRRHPVRHGLGILLHVARHTPQVELASPRIRSAMRGAATEVLRRDGLDWDELGSALRSCDPAVQETVLDAVEKGGFLVSTHALGGLLGKDERANASILRRLARIPVREARPLAPAVASRLPALLQHDDHAVRRLAVIVAARYRIEKLVAKIVDRLDDPHAAVAATAHRVLRDRTGAGLHPERALWLRWLAGERDWMQKQSARIDERLRSADPDEVLAALRMLAAHPLLTGAYLPGVEAATSSGDPAVRREACATLAELSRPASIPALARRLADDDPAVAGAASEALATVTGLRGPVTADEWRAELLLDR